MARFRDIPQLPAAYYQINVEWQHLALHLKEWGKDYHLDISPDFQRAHVWTREQQIAFLEWILQGGESGKNIYFNCPRWDTIPRDDDVMVLVDGKQRVEAVRAFMSNEIPCFGSLYREYTDPIRSIKTDFIFHVACLTTREEILKWYLKINAGGTPHTSEELDRVRALLEQELNK